MEVTQRFIGDVAIISVSGKLDMGVAYARCRDMIDDLIDGGCRKLVLDLGDVSHIDSTCIGLMVGTHTKLIAKGGGLRLLRTPPPIHRILSTARLTEVLVYCESEERAVESFARPPVAG
jgi:anti-sigma B factor antagonist